MLGMGNMFQSPRSGKFVSDAIRRTIASVGYNPLAFQSPRPGKFVSNPSRISATPRKLRLVSIP